MTTTGIKTYTVTLTPAQRKAFELADAFDYASWYRDNADMQADDPELEAIDLTIEQWREQVAFAAASNYDEEKGVLTLVPDSWLETDVTDYLAASADGWEGQDNGAAHCRAVGNLLVKIKEASELAK